MALLVTLPLVFILFFFGYFPLHYDIVLGVRNIDGEGICQSYGSQVDGRTYVNEVTFYFGSELEKATIKGFYYDVDTLYLVTSDVSKFEIVKIDSYIKGIHLTHFDAMDILPNGEIIEGQKATLSSLDGVLRVDVNDPNEGAMVTISKAFIPIWFLLIYFAVIIVFAILLAFLLGYLYEHMPTIIVPLTGAACIAVTLLAGGFFCGSLSYTRYTNFLLNWLLVFALSLALNAFTLPFLGTLFMMAFITIWYIANYFVIALRGKPIMPADLKAAGTAAEVMGGYTFTPSWKMVLGVFIVGFYGVCLYQCWRKNRFKQRISIKRNILQRAILLCTAIGLFVIGTNTQTFKRLNDFAWDATLMKDFHEEGMVLTYFKSVLNSSVKKPDGYSKEVVDGYLKEYNTESARDSDIIQPTRIIMVMNEAFSDLRGVGLNPQIDVMPFIDSLDENIVEGNLYVSVYGGGTCNTEFEALTGNTLAFLGTGAYPYTENVTEPLFSLASYFQSLNYTADAFHPNEADNWNRDMVYPNLGFEVFHSIEDFRDNNEVIFLHDQPADINDYQYIEAVDKEKSGSPRFLFDVTMQNHSPYERWLDVEKADSVGENGSDLYVDTQVYLSLVKASDDEIRQLVETYQDSAEPTMIIFFGDHQPGLPGTAVNEIYTDLYSNLDLYKSKFFIWTNYDTKEWHNAGISANYLPWLILDRGSFPLPPYVQMLKELYAKYPIISAQGVMDNEGNIYSGVAEVMDDPLIKKYQYIQYANLFDEIDPAWFEVN
ncbi:MAG: sulfatase-like hydrolase/transferase [Butyrivibrio sp.]|nr:sulfatase-like hydrolase/transferase [Butyrivibrio sp.]